MIILDTNVLSELMKNNPEGNVIRWMDEKNIEDVYISSITVAEILFGIGSLPSDRRKTMLTESTGRLFDEIFLHRILSFDSISAIYYAKILILRNAMGSPIQMADAEIAAICLANSAALATRNTGDFINTGVMLINPWNIPE